jgi:hypothetical protein
MMRNKVLGNSLGGTLKGGCTCPHTWVYRNKVLTQNVEMFSQLLKLQLWVGWVLVPWALPVQSHPQKFDQRRQGERPKHQESEGNSRVHWGAHTHWQVCQQPSQSFSGKVQGPGPHDGRSRHGPEKNILKLPRRTYLCRSRLHKGGRKYACKGLPLDPDRHRGSTWGNNRHFRGGRLGKVSSNLRLQSPWTISLHRGGGALVRIQK